MLYVSSSVFTFMDYPLRQGFDADALIKALDCFRFLLLPFNDVGGSPLAVFAAIVLSQ